MFTSIFFDFDLVTLIVGWVRWVEILASNDAKKRKSQYVSHPLKAGSISDLVIRYYTVS